MSSIVLPIPVHKPSDPFLDQGLRLKAGIASQVIHVGISRGDVARLNGEELQLGLPANFVLQDFNELD